jgi:hypothetical protein
LKAPLYAQRGLKAPLYRSEAWRPRSTDSEGCEGPVLQTARAVKALFYRQQRVAPVCGEWDDQPPPVRADLPAETNERNVMPSLIILAAVVALMQAPPPTKAEQLQDAARKGDATMVKKLLDEGVDIRTRSDTARRLRN